MYAKLEERFARLAGFHSGDERAIFDDQGATAATHMHEMIHDRIFYETADGLFHLLVHRMAEQADAARTRARNRILSKALFDETRQAHEAIATYMGIVYLETDQPDTRFEAAHSAAAEYDRLSPDYQAHYAVFGDLLDRLSPAPWLRLSIAWAVAHWAFSSLRLSQAVRLTAGGIADVADIPGPSSRLRAAIQAIANAGTAAWIGTVVKQAMARCAAQGIDWADVDDPREWPAVSGARKMEVTEAALFDVVRAWLDSRVARSLSARQVDEGVAALMVRHGFVFEPPSDALPYRVEESIVDARAQVRAAERGRVHRQQPVELRTFDLAAVQRFVLADDAVRTSLTILANLRWGRRKYRALLRKGNEVALPLMALNSKELRTLLRWRRGKEAGGRLFPPIVVCELSLESDVLSAVGQKFADTGLAVRKAAAPFDAALDGEVFLPVNYIEQALPAIMEHVPGTIYNIDVEIDASGGRVGVLLFVPDDPEVHACIKIVPRYDMGAYLIYQRALQAQGRLKVAATGTLHSAYHHMIAAILDGWEPL